ncbi:MULTISPECIES: antibiotic biosynthesis monooxygenase [unclassified Arcicella]|uniref:antibiotic biosynthesis monooxygenase n=1 Tax=unclassified Arcicella TaxID=2644986 RepID=UPI002864AB7E|nr:MULTISPECIES: antibiotic biosynthesis monooxygenase [unclassified Arcicella]MDR6562865.1 antibiotic biosynthesis monooxygenase (ABM) superfamily enzyme [Arcicella sp. BE51]MDR6812794.1 antibiotic biosynthesis monooxygenase (ABM) superfamily enzyme [Arcicella sp. BE140]MDR6824106.1 antibiotic biosynthesis monooxygenase (ABM) superfamily enzyme [Arcicella sp. BE139]
MENQGASVVITHHIIEGKEEKYEEWLNEIGPICKSSDGFVDWQIIRPIPNLTFIYTVIIRFDSITNLKNWIESSERKQLIEKVTPLFARDDNYVIKSGLDFLFVSETEKPKAPVRWKQYLVTWSAIYPLSLIIPLLILPVLRDLNFPQIRYLDALFISGVIVFLMVYVVMPHYTKLIKNWLYK